MRPARRQFTSRSLGPREGWPRYIVTSDARERELRDAARPPRFPPTPFGTRMAQAMTSSAIPSGEGHCQRDGARAREADLRARSLGPAIPATMPWRCGRRGASLPVRDGCFERSRPRRHRPSRAISIASSANARASAPGQQHVPERAHEYPAARVPHPRASGSGRQAVVAAGYSVNEPSRARPPGPRGTGDRLYARTAPT